MAGNGGLAAHEIWRRLLEARLQQVAPALPRTLRGVVQFEVARGAKGPAFFHLTVLGSRIAGTDGVAAGADVWIETSEEELRGLLDGRGTQGSLRALGKVELAKTLFSTVAARSAARSQVALRCQS